MSPSLETPVTSPLPAPFFEPAWRDQEGRLTGFRLGGLKYLHVLGFLQKNLKAERYLEIGTSTGDSLAVIQGRAVCVDPCFRIARDIWQKKAEMHLYQLTSDEYFARHDPKLVLDGTIELAFIDGMHHYEYLLRDFLNVERHCGVDSVVVLHDCVPWKFSLTRRLASDDKGSFEPVLGAWTGDVWKALPILSELRPDLRIVFLDAPPTGLVAITGLDPFSLTPGPAELAEAMARMDAVPNTEENFWNWMVQQKFVDTRQVAANPDLLWAALDLSPR